MPYSFDLLIKQPIPSHIDTHELFFRMLGVVQQPQHDFSMISLDKLRHVLSQDMYYIAHHLVAYKGNQPLFKGLVVQALQDDLMDFIAKSSELGRV